MSKVHETLTRVLIDRVEARRAEGIEIAPWRQTWDSRVGMPRNLITDNAYRGSNVFMTLCMEYASPYWLTRKQIAKLGGQVKKLVTPDPAGRTHEPYTPIGFWWFPDKDNPKHVGRHAFVKFYQVWNTEQVEGIEEHPRLVKLAEARRNIHRRPHRYAEAEALTLGYRGPEIKFGFHKACYAPALDLIEMPNRDSFESAEAYYLVLFHELVHSTGHRNRLARDGVANHAKFATHEYSEEELVAEMGAAMLAGFAGIDITAYTENTAAYLDTWLKRLKRNPKWLFSAGGMAQKAIDHIRGIRWEKPEE